MKYANLSAFEKHLEGAAPQHFADIYMVLSKEEFIRKHATACLIAQILKGETSLDLSLRTIDAERDPVDGIFQELDALSFFSKKRMLVIQNADSLDKATTGQLEKYFNSPNRTICLVLVAASLNRATNFYKKAEKAGVVLDAAEEKPWEKEKSVAEWLRQEVLAHKKSISSVTCQQIVKQLGTDRMLLSNEMQKLFCFLGDKTSIDSTDVAAICTSINVENIWQLGEAIFQRNVSAALRISKGLMDDGAALIGLLRQIRTQFQTEYQVCSILNSGGTALDITQEFAYMKGNILDRHISQATSYGMTGFKKGLLAIDEAELQAKNSSVDPDFLLEMLIIKLTVK